MKKKPPAYVSMATMYSRMNHATEAIRSLVKQVDKMYVILNAFTGNEDMRLWQDTIKAAGKVNIIISDNRLGDAERMIPVTTEEGIWLTVDDDLIYPKDYVMQMRSALTSYGGIVSHHGKAYGTEQIETFYLCDKRTTYLHRCLYDAMRDVQVDIPGSGVMAWNGSQVDLRYKLFERKNMADIEVARIAQAQGVQITALAHSRGWIKYNDPGEDTIWNQYKEDCTEQTRVVNEVLRYKHMKEN